MNKTAIKNFAVRARNKLIEDIVQKAFELGITKDKIKDIEIFEGGFRIKGMDNGKTYRKYELKQRDKLISNINTKGFEQVIEEVAYTWFNRIIALRFMEVNEYLPTGVRVLSSVEEGKTEPDIIKEALNVDLNLDQDILYKIMDNNDTEDLYKYLFIKQCNQLGKIMPQVFEEISDYTELLLPDNLLSEGSVIRDLVESVDEEDYKDQVEIIGWMYQYYISEKKDEVFADLKKNKKITKENIPAATQLFTPKWIVKYMVENSLGRLWLESHPDEELQASWKYYLEEAEQDPEVQKQLDELKNPNLNPKDIKVLDPAMGSGHILVYAFDVLYDIYLKANYSEREIPQLILENNLYGLDIDDRAGQLAAFALMMKARSKNRRIFRNRIELNICSIEESNGIPKEAVDFLVNPKDKGLIENLHKEQVEYLIEVFNDAKEYGSILDVKKIDFDALERRIEEIRNGDTLDLYELQYREVIIEKIPPLIKQGRIMSHKYDVVCTNPPYMGIRSMNSKLSNFILINYPKTKYDLFSIFMEKCFRYCDNNKYLAMITQHSWMFLISYKSLREYIIENKIIETMVHLGTRAFDDIGGEVVQTTSFVIRNKSSDKYRGKYIRLVDFNNSEEKLKGFFDLKNVFTNNEQYKFKDIPEYPIAYWIKNQTREIFIKGTLFKHIAKPRQGLSTSDNDRFLRLWFEVNTNKIGFNIKDDNMAISSKRKWFPLNKGGSYRKWYGNNEYLINWEDDGLEIKKYASQLYKSYTRTIKNIQYYFKKNITWSRISSSKLGVRYNDVGFIFSDAGCCIFPEEHVEYILAFLGSKVTVKLLEYLNPTLTFQVGNIDNLPLLKSDSYFNKILILLVNDNIDISKIDWDSFETSWDFKKHPIIQFTVHNSQCTIKQAFENWNEFTTTQFNQLKANEEEVNRIFIEIYGLQDELTPEVEDKDITIRKADRERDIKSFISYAVGCMFGRYSLDEEGLIYAGGEFDINRYKTFIPTKDNVLVIADDEYFEDDIVNRFVEFVKISFGDKSLEENLDYIAETLGNKTGKTSRQTIRRYFLKDFYNDHLKVYQKRPIYWQFDSGKNNGFKALIYLHRYNSSTVARVRTDYLHTLQRKYEAEIKHLDIIIDSEISPRDLAAAKKRRDIIIKQLQECRTYDQIIAHIANQNIELDLDDGVVVNYAKFQGVEVSQGDGKKPLKADLLTKLK